MDNREANGSSLSAAVVPGTREALDARQRVVIEWGERCFGADHMRDKIIRAARFFEEAAELVQSVGLPRDHAMRAFDHVYSRLPGEAAQEAGGVANTLMALCGALDLSFDECQQEEINRCLAKDPAHFAKRNEAKLREVDSAAPVPPADGAEAQACLDMLILCGDLGGKQPSETYPAYLRRLIDFVTVRDQSGTGAAEPVAERQALADKIRYLHNRGLLGYHGDYSISDDDYKLLMSALLALPPVRGDREAIARIKIGDNAVLEDVIRRGLLTLGWVDPKCGAQKMLDALSLHVQSSAPSREIVERIVRLTLSSRLIQNIAGNAQGGPVRDREIASVIADVLAALSSAPEATGDKS